MKFKEFIYQLLLGNPKTKKYTPSSFYKKQKQNLSDIWNNKTYKEFGIERILRLILQILAFVTPGGLIRHITGKSNLLTRKLGIELFGIMKVIFIYSAFKFNWTTNTFVLILIITLTLDTLHFLISRILLNDVFREAISHKRSLIMTFINYIEICLCFAFIYSYVDDRNLDTANPVFHISSDLSNVQQDGHLNDTQSIYFSFITAATIGYGDISPKNPLIMKLVIIQIVISLLFIVVFISSIINKLHEDTFYNKKKENSS